MFTASTGFGTRLGFCATVATTGKLPFDKLRDSVVLFQNSRYDAVCFVIKVVALLFFCQKIMRTCPNVSEELLPLSSGWNYALHVPENSNRYSF
jgi:hypothetical protein